MIFFAVILIASNVLVFQLATLKSATSGSGASSALEVGCNGECTDNNKVLVPESAESAGLRLENKQLARQLAALTVKLRQAHLNPSMNTSDYAVTPKRVTWPSTKYEGAFSLGMRSIHGANLYADFVNGPTGPAQREVQNELVG